MEFCCYMVFPSIPRRRFSHFISPSFFFFPPFQLFFLSRFFFFPFPLYFFISRGQKRGVEGGGERKAGVVVCSTLFPFPPFLHFPRRERKRSGGREAEYLPLLDIFCAKGPAAHVCSSFAHKNILKIKKKPVNNYFSQIQCIRWHMQRFHAKKNSLKNKNQRFFYISDAYVIRWLVRWVWWVYQKN